MGFVLNHHHTVKNRRRAFKCWDQTEPKFTGICTGFNSAAQNVKFRDFCGAPGVKSPCFQCRRHRVNPWSGEKISHATGQLSPKARLLQGECPHTVTKTQHSQNRKESKQQIAVKRKQELCGTMQYPLIFNWEKKKTASLLVSFVASQETCELSSNPFRKVLKNFFSTLLTVPVHSHLQTACPGRKRNRSPLEL